MGKVIGTVVSTRKNVKLVGNKLLIVKPIDGFLDKKNIVAIDDVGAGIGEIVLVTFGSAARIGCNIKESPVDAAIVGIIDNDQDIYITE